MTIETNLPRGTMSIGEDKTVRVTVRARDSNGVAPGDEGYIATPQTMTGWTFQLVLKKYRSDGHGDVVLTATSATLSNASGTDDRVAMAIADTDTDALVPGPYEVQVWRNDAGSEVCLAKATLQIEGGR